MLDGSSSTLGRGEFDVRDGNNGCFRRRQKGLLESTGLTGVEGRRRVSPVDVLAGEEITPHTEEEDTSSEIGV